MSTLGLAPSKVGTSVPDSIVSAYKLAVRKLKEVLSESINRSFYALYKRALAAAQAQDPTKFKVGHEIREFQENLREIPDWTNAIIQDQVLPIIKSNKHLAKIYDMAWLGGYYVLNSLSSVDPVQQQRLRECCPKLDAFLFESMKKAAERICADPYLYSDFTERNQDYLANRLGPASQCCASSSAFAANSLSPCIFSIASDFDSFSCY